MSPPVTPLAHYLEYLDLAGAVLAAPLRLVDGLSPRAAPIPA